MSTLPAEITNTPDDHSPVCRCACGAEASIGANAGCHPDPGNAPVLNVQAIPHQRRHTAIFGMIDNMPIGGALVVVAPHEPSRLLHQLQVREPGAFTISFETRGPDYWRMRLVREALPQ